MKIKLKVIFLGILVVVCSSGKEKIGCKIPRLANDVRIDRIRYRGGKSRGNIVNPGSKVFFKCKMGLSMYGRHRIKCKRSGKWDRNPPKCKTKQQDFASRSVFLQFFYGYLITQIPGGYLAARFGGKNVFGGGILMTALLTLLTPLAARGSMYLLIALRVLEGLFNGVAFPCMHAIWSKWAPPMERSKLFSMSHSGSYAGTICGMMLSGIISHNFGWPAVFYFFGTASVIWSALWFWLVTDSPFDHPTITDEEVKYLEAELAEDDTEEKVDNVPWKKIATSIPFWAIIVAHTTENWGYYTLLTSLPTYLKKVFYLDVEKTGFFSALPYFVLMIAVIAGGRLADYLRTRKILSTTAVRKVLNSLGFSFKALLLLLVGYASNKDIAILELTLALAFSGLAKSGFMVNHLDIAPRYASLLLGITNCFATISGILSPTIIGIITKNETQEEWRYVFIVASAALLFGSLFFLIFSSGEKQPWAQADEKKENVPLLNGKNGVTFSTWQSTATSA